MDDPIELKDPGSGELPAMPVEALDGLCGRIVDLTGQAEEYFISVGMKVQEYSEWASRITRSAMSASGIMAGGELTGTIEGLESMVNQLEDIFNRVNSVSNRNLETLTSIGRSVGSVEKELSELSDTSSDLRMLALSTKIQSTRTGSRSAAFMHLGQNIAQMSVIISNKVKELFGETTILADFVVKVKTTLHHLQAKLKFQTESVLKGTRDIIGSMAEMSDKSISEAERIREHSENISVSLSDMVTAVQYQDITRQAMDRIVKDLHSILDNARSKPYEGDEAPALPPSVSPEIMSAGHCMRQARRLDQTGALMHQALDSMVLSLETISANVESMTAVTREANRETTRFLHDLESTMALVTSFLKEVVQSSRQMSGSMKSLAQTVEGMSEFTEDIEMISSEVELISLNAIILAAQTGVEGAGMGVIAKAVQQTAVNSEELRRAIVTILVKIARASIELKGEIEDSTLGEESKLDQIVRELGVFLDALRVMQERIVSTLLDINSQGDELVKVIVSTVEEIREQLRLERGAAEIVEELDILAMNYCRAIDPADLVTISGGSFNEEELVHLEEVQLRELVEVFFDRHYPDDQFQRAHGTFSEEGDIVFFDGQG